MASAIMNYLEKWLHDLATRQSEAISKTVRVVGVRDKILGPRSDFARIEVICEPASKLEVVFDVPNATELEQEGYLEWATLGLLDVLMTGNTYPLRNVRLTIKAAEVHPIHSNQMAFRHAGRDAGRQILEALKPKKAS